MRGRVVIILVLVSLFVGVAATGLSATPRDDFYVEKACGPEDTLWDMPACIVTYGEGAAEMFVGGWMVYEDRVLWEKGEKVREIARVYLVTEDKVSTLRGQIRWLDDSGMFTFSKGSGDADGIHANGTIDFLDVLPDGRYLFSLSGTAHVE